MKSTLALQSRPVPKHDAGYATTRGGTTYRIADDVWHIRDGVSDVSLNFRLVIDLLSPQMLDGLKKALVWLLANRAPATVENTFGSLGHMLRETGRSPSNRLTYLTNADLISYRAALADSQVNRLHTLRILVKRWHALDIECVSKSAIEFLNGIRLKAPTPGEPVRTMCPFRGPLTAMEDEAYQAALNTAYAEGRLSDEEFFASWLSRALGQRPSQTAALKVCDLMVEARADGTREYLINVPRAKQRTLTHPRAAVKVRPLIQQIGAPLHAYVRVVVERFERHLVDPNQAPMFPRPKQLAGQNDAYLWHRSGNEMATVLIGVSKKLEARSERTGKPLHITPSRLRRTVGTRAAQEGHGELIVAEILDHSNAASARFYVEAVPEILARIDAATAHAMAPLARAFQGLPPASSEGEAGDPGQQIIDLRIDQSGKSMGQCTGASCDFLAPVACYTCRAFRPWIDGPHEAVLKNLLLQRDAQLASSAPRVAAVHDRTILAVTEVLQICNKLLKAGEHG